MRTPFPGWCQNKIHNGQAVLLVTLLLVFLSPGIQARDGIDDSQKITIQVFGKDGISVAGGTLVFKGAGEVVHQFEINQSGTLTYSAADFDLQEIYRVSYEDSTGLSVCILDQWQFKTEDYDQQYDARQNVNKFLLKPSFWNTGKSHLFEKQKTAMEFYPKKIRNPWWYDPLVLSIPKYFFAAQVCFLFGDNWTTNEKALGGVVDNSSGFHFLGSYRFGFPKNSRAGSSVIYFREISLSYDFNRYDINQAYEPGITADVHFHRITASYSFGRMSISLKNHYCLGPALSVGGIYDGATPLEYMDRSYGLVGIGAQGKLIHRVVQTGKRNLGLHAQLELMYYPADRGENDFWYGLAPGVSLGVVIY